MAGCRGCAGSQLSLHLWFATGGNFVSRTWQCLETPWVVKTGERGGLLASRAQRAAMLLDFLHGTGQTPPLPRNYPNVSGPGEEPCLLYSRGNESLFHSSARGSLSHLSIMLDYCFFEPENRKLRSGASTFSCRTRADVCVPDQRPSQGLGSHVWPLEDSSDSQFIARG